MTSLDQGIVVGLITRVIGMTVGQLRVNAFGLFTNYVKLLGEGGEDNTCITARDKVLVKLPFQCYKGEGRGYFFVKFSLRNLWMDDP